MSKPIIYHIPVCPFSQRVEILLELKGLRDAVQFEVVDVTRPRADWLLAKSRGSTALPIMELENGEIIKESLVILRYIEECFPQPPVMRTDPYQRAVENMMVTMEGEFTTAGYRYVMSQDPAARDAQQANMLGCYARLSDFLTQHNPDGTWLFDTFGYAETVFTPMMMRFWFLEYYEGFALPDDPQYRRVRHWHDACLSHPATQQVSMEEIVKLYYDYARGAGNGALLPGRRVSSFSFQPDWRTRPWPPKDKYSPGATDAQLGLADAD